MLENYKSPFDSYEWSSPWEKKSNKKNPFDTNNNTSKNQDTSAFDNVKEWKTPRH